MIDAILSDRADERRGLFEEAAGIGKYKDRRKAALRRLERAEMDLQRLEDVIGEVQTKVRSLARQKGKAQRYTEYRQRRLDVEVAVVRHQLDTLRERLAIVDKELAGDIRSGEGVIAELATAEAEFEALRLRQVDAERNRSQAAKELDGVREHLVRWERELAVADERGAYAERRLAQIDEERGQTRERAERLHQEQGALERDRGDLAEELAGLKGVADERAEEVASVRARLIEAREALEAVEARARDLARRGAQLEGDADASEAQAEELGRRIEQVDAELASASETLTDLESQGDLFSGRVEDLADTVGSSRAAMETAETAVAEGRARFEAARAEEREAAAEAAALSARRSALERLQEGWEGVQPVVKAALGLGDDGVLAPLSDYVEGDADTMRAAEAYLGTLATALVVRDSETLERIVAWFRQQWSGGGGLIALPLDRVPATAAASGGLLARLTIRGAGAPWVRALLDGVELSDWGREGVPVTERGGVVRIGDPGGGSGVLERKEELRGLAVAHEAAVLREEQAREALALAERTLAVAESTYADARERFRTVEDDHRRVASELAAQADHRGRVDRMRGDLARQLEGTRAAKTRAGERARAAREDRAALLLQESGIQGERDRARSAVETVQEEWETARAEEARLAVDVARLEGDVARYSERLAATTDALEQALGRVAALASEESGLRDALDEARRTRTEGDEATERLFAERTRAEAEVQARDELLQEVAQALSHAERRVREARTAERASVDHRHALELEQHELTSRIERIRERLEGEWGRPLDSLLEQATPVDGDPEVLQVELNDLVQALEALGPVNMLAVEEHEEESERLDFLTAQRADLVEARNDLRSAIREINKTATDLFTGTFEDIRENFRKTFLRLFEGGEADIWLQEPDDPLESPIEIHASPRGKRTQRIDLLSGGERALTALSLLFGIYLVKPSPFCVLDEVDAPLDENNIGRFIRLLEEFKSDTQFVVITHNPRTIEAADWIYGVTMEEPGVSTIVGVKLQDALQAAGAA
jgi:chromosome segregation protein